MSALETIRKLKNLKDVAAFLSCEAKYLSYLLYFEKEKYYKFEIKKKSGGSRIILAPNKKLKTIQKKLSDILYDCYSEIYPLNKYKVVSHGYIKRTKSNSYGIISNALSHKNKHHVLNLDLSDYFPSFNFGRVRGFFIKNRDFNLSPDCATVLAQIACYENMLPQGSPCSPIIANFISRTLDSKLVQLAKKNNLRYSRYVDDITFSTNKKSFPSSIASVDDHKTTLSPEIRKIISKNGFIVNEKKTRLQYADSRQEVTGLIVNKFVNIPFEYRHKLRAYSNYLFKHNSYFFKDDENKIQEGSIEKLNGMLSYVHFIRKSTINKDKYIRDKNGDISLDAADTVYSDFLFYKYFAHNKKPVIVCEGKTDTIYLRAVLKTLAKDYPSLVEVKDGKASFKIQILPASKTVQDLLGLLTGTGDLRKFLESYEKRLKKYSSPSLTNPVIILVDNDEGPRKINNLIKSTYNIETQPGIPYLVNNNLVYARTPTLGNVKDTMVEDFFSEGIRKLKVRGKTFSPNNEEETIAHYGKKIFAEEIISKKRKVLDFTSFKPILDLLVEAISIYENRS